jgi:hypothetical protein
VYSVEVVETHGLHSAADKLLGVTMYVATCSEPELAGDTLARVES